MQGVRAEETPPPPPSAEPPGSDAASARAIECLGYHEQSQLARRDGHLKEAQKAALACAQATCPALVRADCFEWLEEVRLATPSLMLAASSPKGDESAVRVTIDGQPLVEELTGQAVAVNPGRHELVFELPPFPNESVQIVVREGEKDRLIAVRFGPPPEAPASGAAVPREAPAAVVPESRPGPTPLASYALGGLTALSAGVGAYYANAMVSNHTQALRDCAPFCPKNTVEEIRRQGLIADTAFGVAVLSAVAGLIVYWTRPDAPPSKPAPQVRLQTAVGRDSMSLSLGGSF